LPYILDPFGASPASPNAHAYVCARAFEACAKVDDLHVQVSSPTWYVSIEQLGEGSGPPSTLIRVKLRIVMHCRGIALRLPWKSQCNRRKQLIPVSRISENYSSYHRCSLKPLEEQNLEMIVWRDGGRVRRFTNTFDGEPSQHISSHVMLGPHYP
jgi:hypothetical protein